MSRAKFPTGTLLVGPMAIPGGVSASIVAGRSFNHFRPKRFVYGGAKETFEIMDVKVGRSSQWMNYAPGVSADCFPPYPDFLKPVLESDELSTHYFEMVEKLDNFPCEVVQVSMDLVFWVRNVTRYPAVFGGVIYGENLDVSLASYQDEPKEKLPVVFRSVARAAPEPLPNYDISIGSGALRLCAWCRGTGGEVGLCDGCKGTGRVRMQPAGGVSLGTRPPAGGSYILRGCHDCLGTGGEAGLCTTCKGSGSVRRWPESVVA